MNMSATKATLALVLVLLASCYLFEDALPGQTRINDSKTGWPLPPDSAECWAKMPSPIEGTASELPSWIRMVAREMPRTAAAFLELDNAHRKSGPVDPKLRAAMRWVAANANGCEYSRQIAAFDAHQAGISPDQWESLTRGDQSAWSEQERLALKFALDMAADSDSVTDQQFLDLSQRFGERVVAAMVLHMAYANFQDRLIQCLGVAIEPTEPLPPLNVKFAISSLSQPAAGPPATAAQPSKNPIAFDPDSRSQELVDVASNHTWLPYEQLQERLQEQRARRTRLRIPDWQEFAGRLPTGLMPAASDIVWYKIVFGYAHELAVPFEVYMRTAGSEIAANWDRDFGNSLFWIVTDTVKCPYCMGHCEMNWEVTGLDSNAIESISQQLAGDDWTQFSEAQRTGLAFARKLTQNPAEINRDDIDLLRQGFGDQRAFFIAVNVSRYNYMTRISNGFQLTLETGNPFYQYYNKTRPIPEDVASEPRPTPLRRDEMKRWLESMKQRRERVALPPLTPEEQNDSDGRNISYESRLNRLYLPQSSGARSYLNFSGSPSRPPRPGDNRPAATPDPSLTLDYAFKTRLFWIASRVNNCQYCLGHQESKLLATGMSDDQIAALDLDWSSYPAGEQAAFALAKRLTLEPQRLSDQDFDACRSHYTDLQILEMVLSVAGNNAINRWKEGIGVQQSHSGGNFGATTTAEHTYLTPTSPELADKVSTIVGSAVGNESAQVVPTQFDSDKIKGLPKWEAGLALAANRQPRFPLKSVEETKSLFADLKLPTRIPNWMRVLANFPVAGHRQVSAFLAAERNSDLSDLTRARLAWVIAHQNGAWYSMAEADQRLLELGQTREQILELLDFENSKAGDILTARDKSLLTVAKKLAASPVVLTDREAQLAIDLAGPREFVQTVHYTSLRSLFDRFTEASLLPVD